MLRKGDSPDMGKSKAINNRFKALAGSKKTKEALRESEERFRRIVDRMPVMMDAFNEKGKLVAWNKECERVTGFAAQEVIGNPKALSLFYPDERYRKSVIGSIKKVGGDFRNMEFDLTCKDGSIRAISWSNISDVAPVAGWSTWAIGVDITERKKDERLLQQQRLFMEQKNIALKELLEQFQVQKNRTEEDVLKNVSEIVMPLLNKLKLKGYSRKYIDLLKENLETLTSSFGHRVAEKNFRLTPKEIEISNMVKGGLASKEIADFLNVSNQTVEKHRKNIRKKLAISKKKVNLTSFLQKL